MFREIFPDKLNRLVYQKPKKGAPNHKETTAGKPKKERHTA